MKYLNKQKIQILAIYVAVVFFIISGIFVVYSGVAMAQKELRPTELNPRDASLSASYVFRLQYNKDTQTLSYDSAQKYPYSIIIEKFVSNSPLKNAPFSFSIVSHLGTILAQSSFDPLFLQSIQINNKNYVVLKAPYFANAGSVIFYKKSEKLFSISVSQSSFCNENAACNSSMGESRLNCAVDCDPNYKPSQFASSTIVAPPYQQTVPAPPPSITNTSIEVPVSFSDKMPLLLIFVIVFVIIALFVLFFVARRIKNKN